MYINCIWSLSLNQQKCYVEPCVYNHWRKSLSSGHSQCSTLLPSVQIRSLVPYIQWPEDCTLSVDPTPTNTACRIVILKFYGGGYRWLGANIYSIKTWTNWKTWMHIAPAVGSTLLFELCSRRVRNVWALPGLLLLIPGLFYAVLALTNYSLEEARLDGWVTKPQEVSCLSRNERAQKPSKHLVLQGPIEWNSWNGETGKKLLEWNYCF